MKTAPFFSSKIAAPAFLLTFILVLGTAVSTWGQTNAEHRSLAITTVIQESPAQVTLHWVPIPDGATVTSHRVMRRPDGGGSPLSPDAWTNLATLDANALSYTDTTAEVGVRYEYWVRRNISSGGPTHTLSDGYISVAINAPILDRRGTLLLVVEEGLEMPLAAELDQLEMDLIGDGWLVERLPAPRTQTFDTNNVEALKTAISQRRTALLNDGNPDTDLRMVYLFGRVAVPYSGTVASDGHTDHSGAWPADAYYADFHNGSWPDAATNTNSARTENHNLPGDGKYDVIDLSNSLDWQQPWELAFGIGRVDLSSMPAFGEETELLRHYLEKSRAWRFGERTAPLRGIYWDSFDASTVYTSTPLNNMRSLLGENQVTRDANMLTTLRDQPHVWAAGAGGGTYTSAVGIGTSFDFLAAPRQAIFFNLFGSYFADWDNENNFLRAPLAMRDWGLTSDWGNATSGLYSPLHRYPMGVGHPIGETQRRSVRFTSVQWSNLMGDPSLRLHIVPPPSALQVSRAATVTLSWTAAPDANQGYHIYRSSQRKGFYERLTAQPVVATTYEDATPPAGDLWYMVRAVRRESTNSGTYDNASQGIFAPAAAAVASVPSGFAATVRTSTRVDVTWTAFAADLPPWVVVEKAASAEGPFAEVAIVEPGVSLWSDTAVGLGETVFYRLRSRTAVGDSAPTSVAGVTLVAVAPAGPDAPQIEATQSNRVDLAWATLDDTTEEIRVQRAFTPSGPWSTLATLPPSATQWRDTSTWGEQAFVYRVVAVNLDGATPGATTSVTTPRALPAGLLAEDLGAPLFPEGLATFDGTTVSLTSGGFFTDGNNDRFVFAGVPFSGDGDFVTRITPAADGGSYNDGGIMVRASRDSNATMFMLAANRRADSQNLRARWRESAGVSVGPSRTAGVGPIDRPVWLRVSRRGDVFTASHSQDGVNWTLVTEQTLANLGSAPEWGLFYTHAVTSWGSGTTTFTNVSLNPPPPSELPAAPGVIRAAGANRTTVLVSWQDLSDNEAGFEVQRAAAAEGPWTTIGTTGINETSLADTNVAQGATWFYRVRSFNALGESAWSGVASGSAVDGVVFHNNLPGASPYLFNGDRGVFTLTAGAGPAGDTALVHDSGSVRPNAVLQQAVSGGESRTISMLFQWRANDATGGSPFYLGVGSRADYFPLAAGNGTATDFALHLGLQKSNDAAQTNRPRLFLYNPFEGGNNTATSAYLGSDLVDGHWHRITLTITRGTGNAFVLQGILESLGANATTAPEVLLTHTSASWNNAQMAALAEAYPYFGGQNSFARGIAAVDDLFVSGLTRLPAAPGAPMSVAATLSSISMAWPSETEGTESGFAVERASSLGGPFVRVLATGTGVNYATDSGLPEATSFYYRVRTLDVIYGQSDPSPTALLSTLTPPPIQRDVLTFDTPGDFTNAFTTNGAWAWEETNGEGILGSRALTAPATRTIDSAVWNQSIDGGTSRLVSLIFRWQTNEITSGQPLFLGVGPSVTYVPTLGSTAGTAEAWHIYVALDKNAEGTVNRPRLRLSNRWDGGASVANLSVPVAADLVDGRWYRLRLVLDFQGAGQYSVTGALDDFGSHGTTFLGTLLTQANTFTNNQLAADGSSHVFFGGQNANDRGIAAVDQLVVSEIGPLAEPMGLTAWRNTHFTSEELSNPSLEASLWGMLADPDGDGVVNLWEYALGGNPLVPGSAQLPEMGWSGDRLTLSFTPEVTAGLVYLVEGSNDLVQWDELEEVSALPEFLPGRPFTFTDNVALGVPPGEPRRFLRLRLQMP